MGFKLEDLVLVIVSHNVDRNRPITSARAEGALAATVVHNLQSSATFQLHTRDVIGSATKEFTFY